MKTLRMILFLLMIAAAGCAGPGGEQLRTMDLGEPPADYEAKINAYFADELIDPNSAHIEVGAPEKASYRSWEMDGRLWVGYLCRATVNAKNRMGGYTGKQLYGFIFKNGSIAHVILPGETGKFRTE